MYELKGLYEGQVLQVQTDSEQPQAYPLVWLCNTTIYSLIRVGKVRMYIGLDRGIA
jgi:hypothetical protein